MLEQKQITDFSKLVAAAKEKDKEYKVFGASSHKYHLNPVTTLEKVQAFEEKYGLKLPEAYVTFLTQVGNGGAGPYYGLYSLETVEQYNSDWLHQKPDKEPMIDKNLSMQKWNNAMIAYETSDDEKSLEDLYVGMLIIGTQGCTYDTLLMCKGSEQGKIVYIDWNLEENYPPFLTGMTFEQWYENFFQEILAERNLTSYGYRRMGSEKELLEDYQKINLLEIHTQEDMAEQRKQKEEILCSFFRFRIVSVQTLDFLENLLDNEFDHIRLALLLKLDIERGMKLFEQLLYVENPSAAVCCARQIPQMRKNQYYKRMLELLYEENTCNKSRILFYLDDCNCKRAEDIVDYAMDCKNSEDTRRTAVYVMGNCFDASKCLENFIVLMRGEVYWLAHAAFQATIRMHSTALQETYLWMKEHYKNDTTMQRNLAHVLHKAYSGRNEL